MFLVAQPNGLGHNTAVAGASPPGPLKYAPPQLPWGRDHWSARQEKSACDELLHPDPTGWQRFGYRDVQSRRRRVVGHFIPANADLP
jgi:hypothetical protein